MIESPIEGRLPEIDYSRHPAYALAPDPELGRQALEILSPLLDEMRQRERLRSEHFGYRYGYDDEAGQRLVRDGLLPRQLSSASTQTIVADAAPAVATVEARVAALKAEGKIPRFSDRFELIDHDACPELWTSVRHGLDEIDAFRLTKTYFGASMVQLHQMAAMVSSPDDREISIGSGEGGRLPTVGMHVDSSGRCLLKIVLYLSEVGPEDGPFSIVPTSHRWSPTSEDRIYRRAFDKSSLSGRTRNHRRMFISLPKPLQVKAEFGGDLLPNSPDSQRLLAAEVASLGSPGLVNLFDPDAVHRGGMVTTGARRALLVNLIARY